jgi:pyruvate dehydrogenase E1 component alpha subunit
MHTYRFGGHYVGDAEVYRDASEVSDRKRLDPVKRWEAALISEGWATADEITRVWQNAEVEVEAAQRFAEQSADPDPSTALDDVFTEAGP